MGVKVSNNAFGTISAGINSSATTVTLDSGQGARFPTLGGSDHFYGTLIDTNNNVEIIKGFSLEVVNKFDDETFDWIYIDANHNYDSVKADLVAWIPKVKIGGWISGHDWDHPDVKKALLEEFPNEDITAGIYPPQSWVIKKDR